MVGNGIQDKISKDVKSSWKWDCRKTLLFCSDGCTYLSRDFYYKEGRMNLMRERQKDVSKLKIIERLKKASAGR